MPVLELSHPRDEEAGMLYNKLHLSGEKGQLGMDVDTRLCLTWRTSKDLLHISGNSAPCHVAAGMGGGEWIAVYVWLNPFAVHLKLSHHC